MVSKSNKFKKNVVTKTTKKLKVTIKSKKLKNAKEHDFAYVLDGKNKDDEKVYRPGLKACEELGIISPLANNNLAKQEIRDYSKQLGIATYNKPSNACLAERPRTLRRKVI